MKIYAYFCGELDHQFTDTDDKQVEEMCRRLDDPDNDTRSYELEGGRPILFWRRDGRIHGNITACCMRSRRDRYKSACLTFRPAPKSAPSRQRCLTTTWWPAVSTPTDWTGLGGMKNWCGV